MLKYRLKIELIENEPQEHSGITSVSGFKTTIKSPFASLIPMLLPSQKTKIGFLFYQSNSWKLFFTF